MTSAAANFEDYEAINRIVEVYAAGAKAGDSRTMRPAFHESATLFGYFGDRLVAGPIQGLYDGTDKGGPSSELTASVASIEIFGSIAKVVVRSENWSGRSFTDLLALLKVDGQWRIMTKLFHLHP